MSTNSELIAGQLMGALESQRVWGNIIVNVLLYGADPTGKRDSTFAFLTAMRSTTPYSSLKDHVIVYVPPGTYKISSTLYLRKGDILVGAGGTASILNTTVDGIAMVKMGVGLINGIEVTDPGGLVPEVNGIWFASTGASNGIEVTVNGWRIDGCWFTCTFGIVASGTDGIISRCISDGGNHFMYVTGNGTQYDSTHSIIVDDCGVYAPTYAGIKLEGASNLIISNSYFNYCKQFSIYSSETNTSYRVKISNCHFLTSGNSDYYLPTQRHLFIGGGGWADSMIDSCIFARSREFDITILSNQTEGLSISNCKFIDSNGASIVASNGSNLKVSNCEWKRTGGYPIDSVIRTEVYNCDFHSPFVNGLPANDYDKGCVRIQQTAANGSRVVNCRTDSSSVAVLCVRNNASVYAESCSSGWTYDGYYYTLNLNYAIGMRGVQPTAQNLLVYAIIGNTRVFRDAAAPTSGSYLQGDIVEITNPTAGGYARQICVSGGTPGTWKGTGQIQT